jgi:hypothetical protein
MIIKNPDKLLKQWIPATTGNLWFVDDVTLDRYHSVNQTGIQYKLECGTEHMHLYRTSFLTIDIFKNYLEYFI